MVQNRTRLDAGKAKLSPVLICIPSRFNSSPGVPATTRPHLPPSALLQGSPQGGAGLHHEAQHPDRNSGGLGHLFQRHAPHLAAQPQGLADLAGIAVVSGRSGVGKCLCHGQSLSCNRHAAPEGRVLHYRACVMGHKALRKPAGSGVVHVEPAMLEHRDLVACLLQFPGGIQTGRTGIGDQNPACTGSPPLRGQDRNSGFPSSRRSGSGRSVTGSAGSAAGHSGKPGATARTGPCRCQSSAGK